MVELSQADKSLSDNNGGYGMKRPQSSLSDRRSGSKDLGHP